MTGKEFLRAVANGETDLLQVLLDVLEEAGARHCVIGGLAVNAYAEPVVSLDLDLVVATDRVDDLAEAAAARGLEVKRFPHSVNLSSPGSDLRIQLQTDPRYQAFLPRAERRSVLGYPLRVAAVEDVLQGKLWAYQDESRRGSKRQKDLADIARLVEARPDLADRLPEPVRERLA
ncbi:MAG TPA: hypothetical protein VF150_10460 [Thermoanaerobaculia bacterium]